jgi:hypothetical protein
MHMTTYYAGDESGDVSFAFAHGASDYFVIALIRTNEPDEVRSALAVLKKAYSLPEAFEFSFHGITSERLKERVLNALNELPLTAWAMVVNKHTLSEPFHAMPRRTFYLFFLTELIRSIPENERARSILLLDEFDRGEQVLADLGKMFKARNIHRGFKKIKTKRSQSEPLIQCADLIAGSVLTRYEDGEMRYWRLLRGKFIQVLEYSDEKPPS